MFDSVLNTNTSLMFAQVPMRKDSSTQHLKWEKYVDKGNVLHFVKRSFIVI